MDLYSVRVKKSAEKELRSIPKQDLIRIVRRIKALSNNPRPIGCEKLSGEEKYRIRQGDWRIIYWIEDRSNRVEVVKIGHRKEVYK